MFVVHFQFFLLWNSSYDLGGGTARGLGCCVGEAAGIGVRVMAGVGVTTCDGGRRIAVRGYFRKLASRDLINQEMIVSVHLKR
jgi:hypothetical protein